MKTLDLILHLAGPGEAPFPDLAAGLRMVRNARGELGEAHIELVVQGPVVTQLVSSAPNAGAVSVLAAEDGVTVSACHNSLRSAGVEESTLASGIAVVPAAVAHLAVRQSNGAVYVRI